jgi:hypothetical protein
MEGVLCTGVVERDSGRLLAAAGNGSLPNVMGPSVAALARLSGELADHPGGAADTADGDLHDVMITSERLFHVLRQVDVPGVGPVLVYVRLRRGHADPAACRRELASAALRDSVAVACGPPGRAPGPGGSSGTPLRAGRALQPIPLQRGRISPPPPPQPAVIPGAIATGSSTAGRLDTLAHPALAASAPPPRPSAMITTLGGARAAPTPTARPAAPEPDPPAPLPRRVRGRHLPDGPDLHGQPQATPGVPRQGWAQDPRTLRRLLDGLRRLG